MCAQVLFYNVQMSLLFLSSQDQQGFEILSFFSFNVIAAAPGVCIAVSFAESPSTPEFDSFHSPFPT